MSHFASVTILLFILAGSVAANDENDFIEKLRVEIREKIENPEKDAVKDPDLLRLLYQIANNQASGEDLLYLSQAVERFAESGKLEEVVLAQEIAGIIYIFTGDIKPCRVLARITGTHFGFYFYLLNNGYGDENLADYTADFIVDRLIASTRQFYLTGHLEVARLDQELEGLASLPQTAKSINLLLNFPFESNSYIMFEFYDVPIPGGRKSGNPNNKLDWYYREVIGKTPLKKQFRELLKDRKLLDSVSDP